MTRPRNPGEKLYRWEDTANWPAATYRIGVVAYENLVIVRPPAPLNDLPWKWGLPAEVGVALAKLCQRAIVNLREEISMRGLPLEQAGVRAVLDGGDVGGE